jgi:hypothetical protein
MNHTESNSHASQKSSNSESISSELTPFISEEASSCLNSISHSDQADKIPRVNRQAITKQKLRTENNLSKDKTFNLLDS